jgi:hypothetical protein
MLQFAVIVMKITEMINKDIEKEENKTDKTLFCRIPHVRVVFNLVVRGR